MKRIEALVNKKVQQMKDAEKQRVKQAIKDGAKVLGLARWQDYTVPLLYVAYGEDKFNCIIDEDKLEATCSWLKKNYPNAELINV